MYFNTACLKFFGAPWPVYGPNLNQKEKISNMLSYIWAQNLQTEIDRIFIHLVLLRPKILLKIDATE